MVAIKYLHLAGLGSLALAKPDPYGAYNFYLWLQRYKTDDCREAIGGKREDQIGKRVEVKTNGHCYSWKYGAPFGSFDYKWRPYEWYEADPTVDDPLETTTKDSRDGKRYCKLQFWEVEKCQGRMITSLPRANDWDKIEQCQRVYGNEEGSPGMTTSLRLVCRYSDCVHTDEPGKAQDCK